MALGRIRAALARAPVRVRVWAALAIGFLGFGVLLGAATRDASPAAGAGARVPLTVVLASTPTPSSTASSAGEPSAAEPELPAVEAAPTPAPASAPAARRSPAASSTPRAGAGAPAGTERGAPAPASKLPRIRHVFIVMLSDQPYASVFGPASTASYLSRTLEGRGALLVRYDAVAHEELPNELALLSGQGPTAETAANCPTYADISPAGAAGEQVLGSGCVYPRRTRTLIDQLAAKHLSSRAYVEGIDEPGASTGPCPHPLPGQSDPTSGVEAGLGAYATFRNPLVYFHSIVDSPACAGEDVGLARLSGDLAHAKRTPSLLYIAPDRCHDASPVPCAAGAAAGLGPADAFLRRWVPAILASKAYRDGGLLVITTDEAPPGGEFGDSSACCGQPPYPNLPTTTAPTGHGGGTVGALLLSPFIGHASTSQQPYNHFSLLRTIEDVFGVGHLGYAGLPAVKPFEASLFVAGRG